MKEKITMKLRPRFSNRRMKRFCDNNEKRLVTFLKYIKNKDSIEKSLLFEKSFKFLSVSKISPMTFFKSLMGFQ